MKQLSSWPPQNLAVLQVCLSGVVDRSLPQTYSVWRMEVEMGYTQTSVGREVLRWKSVELCDKHVTQGINNVPSHSVSQRRFVAAAVEIC